MSVAGQPGYGCRGDDCQLPTTLARILMNEFLMNRRGHHCPVYCSKFGSERTFRMFK